MASISNAELQRLQAVNSEVERLTTRVTSHCEGLGGLADSLLARVAAYEAKIEAPLAAGDQVKVMMNMSANCKEGYKLPLGTVGQIVQIDEEGDALINFNGIPKHTWVHGEQMHKLTKQEYAVLKAEMTRRDTEITALKQALETSEMNLQKSKEMPELEKLHDALHARVQALEARGPPDVLANQATPELEKLHDALHARVQALEARGPPATPPTQVDTVMQGKQAELDTMVSSLKSRIDNLEINSTDSKEFAKVHLELQAANKSKNELEQKYAQLQARVQSFEAERAAPGAKMPVENNSDMQEVVRALKQRLEAMETQRMMAATMSEELKGSGDCKDLQARLVALELDRRTLQTELAEMKGSEKTQKENEKTQTSDGKEVERLEREKSEAIAQMRQSHAELQTQLTLTKASEQREEKLSKEVKDLNSKVSSLQADNASIASKVSSLQADNASIASLSQSKQALEQANAKLVEQIKTLEANLVESRRTGHGSGHEIPADAQETINKLLARIETLETRQVLTQTMQEETKISMREQGKTDDAYEQLASQLAASESEKRRIQTDFAQYKQVQESKQVDNTLVSQLEQEKNAALAQLQDALGQVQAAKTLQATLQSQLQVFQNRAKQAEDSLNAARTSDESQDKDILLQQNAALQEELQSARQDNSDLMTLVSQKDVELQQATNAKESQSKIRAVSTISPLSKPTIISSVPPERTSVPKVGAPAYASYMYTRNGELPVPRRQSGPTGDVSPRMVDQLASSARSADNLTLSATVPAVSSVTLSPIGKTSARKAQTPISYNSLMAPGVNRDLKTTPQSGYAQPGRYPNAIGYPAKGSARVMRR